MRQLIDAMRQLIGAMRQLIDEMRQLIDAMRQLIDAMKQQTLQEAGFFLLRKTEKTLSRQNLLSDMTAKKALTSVFSVSN